MAAGGIVLAVILLVIFPVLVMLGGFVIAAALGSGLSADADARYEGSELIDLSR